MQLGIALADRVEVRTVELGGAELAALDEPERVLGGEAQGVDDRARVVGGTRKRLPSAAGAFRSTSSSGSDPVWLVIGPGIDEVERMRGRRDVGEVELGHLRDGVEDRPELARQPLDLVLGEVEAREPRHVKHLIA